MERTKDITRPTISRSGPHVERITSPGERAAAGKALRDKIPREQLGRWNDIKGRPDPIDLLHKSDAGRTRKLLPIRYGRMLHRLLPSIAGLPGSWSPTWRERQSPD